MEKVFHLQPRGTVNLVSYAPGGDRLIVQNEEGMLQAWPIYDFPQALIDTARAHVTRRLTEAQREEFNLAP